VAFMVHHLKIDDFDSWKQFFDEDPVCESISRTDRRSRCERGLRGVKRRPQPERAPMLKTAKASKPVKPAATEVELKKVPKKAQEWPKRIRMFSRLSEPHGRTSADGGVRLAHRKLRRHPGGGRVERTRTSAERPPA
jgi:hypothetical protein